jgi:ssDNA-specific exonuclease RecJ
MRKNAFTGKKCASPVTFFSFSNSKGNFLTQVPPAEKFSKKYLEIDKTFNFGAFKALL